MSRGRASAGQNFDETARRLSPWAASAGSRPVGVHPAKPDRSRLSAHKAEWFFGAR